MDRAKLEAEFAALNDRLIELWSQIQTLEARVDEAPPESVRELTSEVADMKAVVETLADAYDDAAESEGDDFELLHERLRVATGENWSMPDDWKSSPARYKVLPDDYAEAVERLSFWRVNFGKGWGAYLVYTKRPERAVVLAKADMRKRTQLRPQIESVSHGGDMRLIVEGDASTV